MARFLQPTYSDLSQSHCRVWHKLSRSVNTQMLNVGVRILIIIEIDFWFINRQFSSKRGGWESLPCCMIEESVPQTNVNHSMIFLRLMIMFLVIGKISYPSLSICRQDWMYFTICLPSSCAVAVLPSEANWAKIVQTWAITQFYLLVCVCVYCMLFIF